MQNLIDLRVGEIVKITHPRNVWSGIITVVEEGADFKCTIPKLLTGGPGIVQYFKGDGSRKWVHLNPYALWKISYFHLENE